MSSSRAFASGALASWFCAMVTVLAACVASAEAAYMPVPWVFTDPKHDPFNPLQYIANNTLSAIAICACPAPLILISCVFVYIPPFGCSRSRDDYYAFLSRAEACFGRCGDARMGTWKQGWPSAALWHCDRTFNAGGPA